mgnify:CR=1 FL=1
MSAKEKKTDKQHKKNNNREPAKDPIPAIDLPPWMESLILYIGKVLVERYLHFNDNHLRFNDKHWEETHGTN